MPANAMSSVLAADVEVRELRDSRPDVRSDNPDPDHLPIRESSQCDPTGGEMTLTRGALMSDGVLPLTMGEPGRRTEIAEPLLEAVTMLDIQGVDPFSPNDLADPRQVCGDKPTST